MAKKMHKTNAVRIIEAKKIPYQVYEYDAPDGFLDGVSVAKATGQNVDQVFKTLCAAGGQSGALRVRHPGGKGTESEESRQAFRREEN